MGYTIHESIVVTSWNDVDIERAHAKAAELGLPLTSICLPQINGFRSFLVAPDGSKEGWQDAELVAKKRAIYVEWLMLNKYPDGSSSLDFVTVEWGEEEDARAKSRRQIREER